MNALPRPLLFISALGPGFPRDRPCRFALGLLEEQVDIDHVDLSLRLELAQERRCKPVIPVVRKTQQVVACRERCEPLIGRSCGQTELQAAVPKQEHLGVRCSIDSLRLEAKPEDSVVIVTIGLSVAICQIAVRLVCGACAVKDAVGPKAICTGTENHRENDQYVSATHWSEEMTS